MSPDDENASLGHWIRRRRKALDLTQARLAKEVGCAVATIKKIEADDRHPSRQMAERLADSLALPLEERAAFLRAASDEVSLHRQAAVLSTAAPARPLPSLPVVPAPAVPHLDNLPAAPNRLIGRRQEVAEIHALLQRTDVCLVTLTGPGGIGKTRLALQAAQEFPASPAVERWFVDLAPVQEATLVIPTLAQTLGVNAAGGQSTLASLKHYLHQRQVLLLLDNFEQVLAAAPQVGELLASAPGLKILATSRAVLHLSGEYEFAVPPLAVPDVTIPADPAALADIDAVALLLARAEAGGARLVLTPANAADVAGICRWLEGLPLAIELAAVRCKLFTPKELLARLADRLPILTTGARDRPQRQQTLRAALDWSYQLLPPHAQVLFARLGVFAGGFTLEAAEDVCRTAGTPALESSPALLDVLDGIATLLDQSLLRPLEDSAVPRRFAMLETLREYAREKLVAHGEEAALRDQHAAYYLALAEQGESYLLTAQHIVEQSNLRAALYWWRTNDSYAQVARLGAALCWFWLKHGELQEEMPRLEWALAETERRRAATPPAVRAKALFSVATGASWQGDLARARNLFEECLQLEEEEGAVPQLCNVFGSLAEVLVWQGDYRRATLLNERYLTLARAHGFTHGMGDALEQLGELVRLQGDYARACQLLQEALILRKAVGKTAFIAGTQGYLGVAVCETGDLLEAERLLDGALQFSYTLEDNMMVAGVTSELGVVAQLRHEYEKAIHYQQRALTLLNELGFQTYTALVLTRLGNLALLQADLTSAHTYYFESLSVCQRTGSKRSLASGLEGLAGVAALSGRGRQAAANSGRRRSVPPGNWACTQQRRTRRLRLHGRRCRCCFGRGPILGGVPRRAGSRPSRCDSPGAGHNLTCLRGDLVYA